MADQTNYYSRQRPADRRLRASDADRNAVGDILRREHVAGRLDADEFEERYGRCLQAKTYAQLDDLLTDLPADREPAFVPGPPVAPDGMWHPGPWSAPRRRLRAPILVWVALSVALIALSGGHIVWFVFPLFFFLFVLRPLMWRSTWRSGPGGPGAGQRGCCGPRGWHSGYPTV